MQAETLTITYFGKVPVHGDFIRHKAAGSTVRVIDGWLQQGLQFARRRLVGAFDAAYDAATLWSFYMAPRDITQVLVGVLGPSRDRVGRAYPFLVAMEAEGATFASDRRAPVPVTFPALFEHASEIVGEAMAGHLSRDQLSDRIEQPDLFARDDAGAAAFERYLQQTPVSSFWERLWGHPQDSRKYLLFKNLLDLLQPLRRGIPANYPLIFRFPLGPDGRTLGFDVSFWLRLCRSLLREPGLQPSFFWTQPDPEHGVDPFLLVALRPPSPKIFAALLPADVDDETLCTLEKMGAQKAALAALSIPAHYGQLLEDEQLSLWDFLNRLSGH